MRRALCPKAQLALYTADEMSYNRRIVSKLATIVSPLGFPFVASTPTRELIHVFLLVP